MTRTKRVPWLLLLIGCGFVILTCWSLWLASQRSSGITDRDYYSHGLRYNQTLLERRTAASQGWSTTIELTGRNLSIRLQDNASHPVAHARGRLTLAGTDPSSSLTVDLHEILPGTYLVELPESVQGERAGEISFLREGARLNKRLLLSID